MATIQYKRFIVIKNDKGLFCLLKFDVLKKEYVSIPSYTWKSEVEAQACAYELNQEHGIIEIEWDEKGLKEKK